MAMTKRACRTICYRDYRLIIALLASVAAAIICYSENCDAGSTVGVATATAAAVPTSTSTTTVADPPSTSSSSQTKTSSPNQFDVPIIIRRIIKSFFDKFDLVGPSLTLTLRDPTSMALLGSSSSSSSSNDYNRPDYYSLFRDEGRLNRQMKTSSKQITSSSYNMSSPRGRRRKAATDTTTDDGTFGLSSKLAAVFHISPTIYPTNNYGQTHPNMPSSSNTLASSHFANGYMLDDGDVLLEPPSSSASSSSFFSTSTDIDTSSSSSRGWLSLRRASDSIINSGFGSRSWLECVRNFHPELRFEVHTKRQRPSSTIITPAMTTTAFTTTATTIEDKRPFPTIAPWLSALSFRTRWNLFPMYYYPEDADGYDHKFMSKPHFVRARAKINIPRFSALVQRLTSTSLGFTKQFTLVDGGGGDSNNNNNIINIRKNEVDLSVTYQKPPNSIDDGNGTVEIVLGTQTSTLSPASKSRAILEKYRKNNHLLIRLATGRGGTMNNQGSKLTITTATNNSSNNPSSPSILPLSSIEYIKGSYRIPNPLFLCSKGVSISPSYNFLEGNARCVFSGDVGSTGRTRAVLRLDAYDSTLTLVRALDENKVIAPTISLNSGKIVYDYYLNLGGNNCIKSSQTAHVNRKVNSSIRAHVDPMTGILIKWTDGINDVGGGGVGNQGSCWVTECRIPLGTSGPGPLAADVRVGRRWVIGH